MTKKIGVFLCRTMQCHAFTFVTVGRFPMRWNTPVVDVMGSQFRFPDELRTRQTTVRDLLAHRTGLPSYKMALMVGLQPQHSRQDYCMYCTGVSISSSLLAVMSCPINQGCRGDGISIPIPIPYPQESPLESPWESPYPRNPK